jgi:hypothetical protein
MAIGFAKDIRPLFTDEDVSCMKDQAIDLSDYNDVKSNANDILAAVKTGRMPPKRPWAPDKVQKFADWIKGGYQP